MSDWHGSSWSSNPSWEGNNSPLAEDLQESRGRRAREGRKARRSADAGVQERRGWHEQGWVEKPRTHAGDDSRLAAVAQIEGAREERELQGP